MKAELLRKGGSVQCVIMELCSYGKTGDFQVLPKVGLEIVTESIRDALTAQGRRAAVSNEALLTEIDGVQVAIHTDGRAVMEGVAPCSCQAAWDLYLRLIECEADNRS